MPARALLSINGRDGQFVPGEVIRGIPDEIVDVWVKDGAAERFDAPVHPDPTPAQPETATAPSRETAVTRRNPSRAPQERKPATPKTDTPAPAKAVAENATAVPTALAAFQALKARAVALGIETKGLKKAELEAAVAAAEA